MAFLRLPISSVFGFFKQGMPGAVAAGSGVLKKTSPFFDVDDSCDLLDSSSRGFQGQWPPDDQAFEKWHPLF